MALTDPLDTKLKADIAEAAVVAELLRRGFRVLQPIGDRLAYDLAVDHGGSFIRIQVKSAWRDLKKDLYVVDVRRTKTNRRHMRRSPYTCQDFDIAILYLAELRRFYVMPVSVFISYRSGISLIESSKRQRPPRSAEYREKWDLLENPHQVFAPK